VNGPVLGLSVSFCQKFAVERGRNVLNLNRAGNWPVIGPLISMCARFGAPASIVLATGLLAMGLFSGPIARAGDDPGDLKAFVGKYPFDRVDGRSLLQAPELRSRLQALLGRSGVNDIDRLSVSVPVEEHAGWIVAHGCRPHNCSEEQWTLAVSLFDYSVRVCLGIEGHPVRYAASGRKLVEQPSKKELPCPETADAMPAFERVFATP
jgi:hypothetical protein